MDAFASVWGADRVGVRVSPSGRWFSSNPDLPERLRRNLPLTPYQRDAFWGGDERAYTDFSAYDAARSDAAAEASTDETT
ncbi:2,4-dienoyl-CoA reductase-like NADH-dependent reductase (Old Yellow Enzyme family) [Paraburkholderia sp. Clong3]|nr:2,4-dienoyl-CoA reductase-like NADH-dependent reductase (Old Yellow Enzyme family) [Paraburkholderia sp. CI2]